MDNFNPTSPFGPFSPLNGFLIGGGTIDQDAAVIMLVALSLIGIGFLIRLIKDNKC